MCTLNKDAQDNREIIVECVSRSEKKTHEDEEESGIDPPPEGGRGVEGRVVPD